MKKKFVFTIVLSLMFVLPLFISNTQALDYYNSQTPEDVIKGTTGINPESMQNPEEITDKYLKKEWAKIISNSTIYGPVHKFLMNNQIISLILFGTNYEFSLTFILMVIFWIIALYIIINSIRTLAVERTIWLSISSGLLITLALSQTRIFHFISKTLIDLISSRTTWWARATIVFAVCIIIILEGYLGKLLVSYLRGRNAKMRREKLTHSQNIINKSAESLVETKRQLSD